jgi:ectoine hydroxylase-related dioxygenase (phytanoyl-CoA dioxygenase family)
MQMGTLAICLGSHRHEKLRATYGSADAHKDLTGGGIFDEDPHAVTRVLGCPWASTDFRMGDVAIFDMYLLHGSLDNQTDRIRLSSDTRYQAASDPVDQRHMGETPDGFARYQGTRTVEEARKEWGI